ncbi:hypothetical protein PR048_001762 [Dryococelus australis]|uniref:Uncharacterized protein n=1 Tax=Dryococelus australis TaxID=614101 RepID=A0ABQ9IIA1_9NEOP|nr:hypothetical protein PR048_001762 [Dryococelus australis]
MASGNVAHINCSTSHQGELGSITDGVASGHSHSKIVPYDAIGWLVFSGISRVLHPFIPVLLHTHLASPSLALKTSMLRATQIFFLKWEAALPTGLKLALSFGPIPLPDGSYALALGTRMAHVLVGHNLYLPRLSGFLLHIDNAYQYVSDGDVLPKFMCYRCTYKLKESYAFQQQCLQTDTLLRSKLGLPSALHNGKSVVLVRYIRCQVGPGLCWLPRWKGGGGLRMYLTSAAGVAIRDMLSNVPTHTFPYMPFPDTPQCLATVGVLSMGCLHTSSLRVDGTHSLQGAFEYPPLDHTMFLRSRYLWGSFSRSLESWGLVVDARSHSHYKVMPFGLKNAPATFQQLTSVEVLTDYIGNGMISRGLE